MTPNFVKPHVQVFFRDLLDERAAPNSTLAIFRILYVGKFSVNFLSKRKVKSVEISVASGIFRKISALPSELLLFEKGEEENKK